MKALMCAAILGVMTLGVLTASVTPAEPSCIHECVVDPPTTRTEPARPTTATWDRFTLTGLRDTQEKE